MGITVELWRARIGQFSGGRGSRPHSKASSTKQPLHFSDTVGTTAKVVQGGLLLLVILKFLSSQDKSLLLKRTRSAGLLIIAIVGLVHSLAHLLLLAGDIESNPGPQMDEVLTLHEHLEDACSKLFKARTEWFNIGLTLGVDGNTLTAIRQEHSSNHGDCLREMLAHRIKATDSLTWGDLCKSLRHVTVGRSVVADKIEADIFSTDNLEVIFGGDSYLDETSATLMEAALNGNVRSVEFLIAAGAQVNYQDEDNKTALYAASSHGHDEVVRVLLAAKATVNTEDKAGQTPLYIASYIGHQKCMELLINAGANVDVTREGGITPLYVAAQNGHVRAVEVLIAAKVQVDIQTKDGTTALYIASQQGHYGVVRMLLEAKAGVHIKNNLGATPLWVASFHGQQKCMELLINAGTNVDVPREDGTTALYVAAQTGHVKAVEVLIAAKAQVDYQNKDGGTALLMASVYGHCGVVRMLLEAKADVNNKSNENLTALYAASEQGHDEIVRVLLAAKATVNTQDTLGVTPLWKASFSGHQKCVELLIDAGANVDVPNKDGTTALIVAAQNGHVRAVEVLIAAKAQVDIQQKDGATALYMASQNGRCGVVRMLLEAKADVNIKNNNNKTALNVAASKNGHHEVVRVLLAAKATVLNTQNKMTTGTREYKANSPATPENPPATPSATPENPPATPERPPATPSATPENPPATPSATPESPPATPSATPESPPATPSATPANLPATKAISSATPEYKAICSCRVELTKKLSACFKCVAEYLRQNQALTDDQCQTIIGIQNSQDGAEKLMDMIIVDIKEPKTTLDAFADFVTAIKNCGNKHFQTFVKDVIETKRKEFYRELLTVPPDFQASQEYDVFISYSHKGDIMRTVDTLMSRLKQEGLSVFVDQRSIQPGDKWRFEIASAIKTCKAFVCVLTKRYMRSVYCNGELYETVALGKRLFPVVCEDGWEDVPGGAPMMEVVQEIQYVSLVAEDRKTQLARLVQSIKGAVTPLSPVPVAPGSSDLPTDQAGKSSSVMEDVCTKTGVRDQQLDQKIPESDIILMSEKFPHLLSVHKALTINDLQHVYEKLHTTHLSASPRWFNLGLALGLTEPVLTNIDSKHRGDNLLSLRAMLTELLNMKGVTWSLLTDGLKKSTVDLKNLADSITATTPNLLNRLNLTPADLGGVTDVTRLYGDQAGVAYALKAWQRVNPSRATFRALVEIAIELRIGTAVDICRFIVNM